MGGHDSPSNRGKSNPDKTESALQEITAMMLRQQQAEEARRRADEVRRQADQDQLSKLASIVASLVRAPQISPSTSAGDASSVSAVPGTSHYSIDAIESRIQEFQYDPEADSTFEMWWSRYEDIFDTDLKEWDDCNKIRLLMRHVSMSVVATLNNAIAPKKPSECTLKEVKEQMLILFGDPTSLFEKRRRMFDFRMSSAGIDDVRVLAAKVNRIVQDADLATLKSEDLKCLVFLHALDLPRYSDLHMAMLKETKNKDREITLERLIEIFNCHSQIRRESRAMQDSNRTSVNLVRNSPREETNASRDTPKRWSNGKKATEERQDPSYHSRQCYRCGRDHDPEKCYFKDKKCRACDKKGHIASLCKSLTQRRGRGHDKHRERSRGSDNEESPNRNPRVNWIMSTRLSPDVGDSPHQVKKNPDGGSASPYHGKVIDGGNSPHHVKKNPDGGDVSPYHGQLTAKKKSKGARRAKNRASHCENSPPYSGSSIQGLTSESSYQSREVDHSPSSAPRHSEDSGIAQVRMVDQELNPVNDSQAPHNPYRIQLIINEVQVPMDIDTGSDITTITEEVWKVIGAPKLKPSDCIASAADGSIIEIKGMFTTQVQYGKFGTPYQEKIYVDAYDQCLIGRYLIPKIKCLKFAYTEQFTLGEENKTSLEQDSNTNTQKVVYINSVYLPRAVKILSIRAAPFRQSFRVVQIPGERSQKTLRDAQTYKSNVWSIGHRSDPKSSESNYPKRNSKANLAVSPVKSHSYLGRSPMQKDYYQSESGYGSSIMVDSSIKSTSPSSSHVKVFDAFGRK